jgi:hypothetical protein
VSFRLWLLAPLVVLVSCVLFALPMLQTSSDIDIATAATGGVIYLESQDLLGQLQRWSDSEVKQRWRDATFRNSRNRVSI